MEDKIKVSKDILEGITQVRETGMTNMFDTRAVAHIAKVMGFTAAAEWVLANKDEYAKGISNGFEAT